MKAKSEKAVSDLRAELDSWATNFKSMVIENLRDGGRSEGGRSLGEGKGAGLMVDKKDVAVWKLPDAVGKPDFRHWCDTVHMNLEAVHRFVYPEIVLDKVRRMDVEVIQGNWHVVRIKQMKS